MMLHAPPDHYGVLGVSRDASPKDITRAFRKLARDHHPDVVAQSDPSRLNQAEEQFKQISQAYNVLSDPRQRSDYDDRLAYGERPEPMHYVYHDLFDEKDDFEPAYQAGMWHRFIEIPFVVAELIVFLLGFLRYAAGIATIIGIGWVLISGAFDAMAIWTFVLTTNGAPDVAAAVPLIAGATGAGIGIAFTVVVWLTNLVSNLRLVAVSRRFRRMLAKGVEDLFHVTLFGGAAIGFLIGRFLF